MKNIQKILGSNLRRLRKLQGLTQEALAEKAGMSWIMIQRAETTNTWPSPETIDKIASALGVDQASLFIDPEKPAVEISNRDLTILKILQNLFAATDGDLRSVLTLLSDSSESASKRRKA